MGWFHRCFGFIRKKKKQKSPKSEPPSREHLLKSTQEESENTKGAQYKYHRRFPAVRDRTEQVSMRSFGDLDGASLIETPGRETLQIVITECPNTRTVCSGCKSRLSNWCPSCRCNLGNFRCLAPETETSSQELTCMYQSYGCEDMYPYYSELRHEAQCNFRPYNCPYAGSECKLVGDIPFLVAHLRDDHKVYMHNSCTFDHRYVKSNPLEVENAIWMPTVINCFGQFFCLHFEAFLLDMAPVYIAFLIFMGDDNEAKNFSYCLETGGNGRKLIWHGVPRSIRDCHRKVHDSSDGLIIQRDVALFFSGGDINELNLRLTGHILKEQ